MATFPWALDREHRFSWIKGGRTKVGETRFRIASVEAPTGSPVRKAYRSSATFWYKVEEFSLEGRHETWLGPDWKPLRFTSRHQVNKVRHAQSLQEIEGRVANGLLIYQVIHNRNTETGVESRMEAPADGFLYQNQSFDNLAILTARVLQGSPATAEARIIYPDLLKTYEVTFTFEKEEAVDLGKAERPLCRLYSFRSKEGQFAGRLWLDPTGRMVQYVQGDLRIFLEP